MLEEVAIAVFTLNSTLYERLAASVRGVADRVSQFSYNDRIDSLQNLAAAGAARVLHALEMLGYPQHRIFWVANAVSEPAALTLRQLRHVMSCKPMAKVPFDPETVNAAAAEGVCLSGLNARAAVTKSIQKLAVA
jgi:MinD-like ATPase involved in chromosome partitioning or flagellar assembly